MSVKVLRNGDLKAILVENYLRNNPNMKYQVITEISFEVFFFFLFSFFLLLLLCYVFALMVILCSETEQFEQRQEHSLDV